MATATRIPYEKIIGHVLMHYQRLAIDLWTKASASPEVNIQDWIVYFLERWVKSQDEARKDLPEHIRDEIKHSDNPDHSMLERALHYVLTLLKRGTCRCSSTSPSVSQSGDDPTREPRRRMRHYGSPSREVPCFCPPPLPKDFLIEFFSEQINTLEAERLSGTIIPEPHCFFMPDAPPPKKEYDMDIIKDMSEADFMKLVLTDFGPTERHVDGNVVDIKRPDYENMSADEFDAAFDMLVASIHDQPRYDELDPIEAPWNGPPY